MARFISLPKGRHSIARKAALVLAAGGMAVAVSSIGTAIGAHYQFALNETDSLPHWAFVIDRSETTPQRGDYFSFVAPPNPYYPVGFRFTKRVAGVPGDVVTTDGRAFFINGEAVGEAKPTDKAGRAIEPAFAGIIPAERYFLVTPHPDSLDSRYRVIGLVSADRLVGRAHPVM